MNKLISFCINTTKFEIEYLKLLFYSLEHNLDNKNHEIQVFIENDTENNDVVNFLLTQKSIFSDLKIIKNPLPIPLGYGHNINILFEKASHTSVVYIQSDMIIGPGFDTELIYSLNKFDDDIVLSCLRIEPPIHPPSSEKITHNFGLNPDEILKNFENFQIFCKQKIDREKITDFFFAPFALKDKKIWTNIGGHDTIFRRSREDSDILFRMCMMKYKIKQCWNAFVYHRSCVSSRGPNWFKFEGKDRVELQQLADFIELGRFYYKWNEFKHDTKFNKELQYKYNICLNVNDIHGLREGISQYLESTDIPYLKFYENLTCINLLLKIFNKIYIKNKKQRDTMRFEFEYITHRIANSLLNIREEDWNFYKKYYKTLNVNEIFPEFPIIEGDIILDMNIYDLINIQKTNEINTNEDFLGNLNKFVHQWNMEKQEVGEFEISEWNNFPISGGSLKIKINKFNNVISDNIIVKNPPIDDINFQIL